MRWMWCLCLLACACGRYGFDPSIAANTDAAVADATVSDADAAVSDATVSDAALPDAARPTNLVFLAPVSTAMGSIGGTLVAADDACNNAAIGNGLPGTYVAFLSTTSEAAIDRLTGARGWRRLDGLPFSDTAQDIAAGRIFYPVMYRADGSASTVEVVTGSDGTGQLSTYPGNCSDYTNNSADAVATGYARGTAGFFADTVHSYGLCLSKGDVYCFGVDFTQPVGLPPAEQGPIAFVAPSWSPSGGLAGADARCQADADAAGLPVANYRALLALGTASARSRFSADGAAWVRPDGVRLAQTRADFFAGALDAPPNVTARGEYVTGWAWSCAQDTGSTGADCCLDWTSASRSLPFTLVGHVGLATEGFYGAYRGSSTGRSCDHRFHLYCLAE